MSKLNVLLMRFPRKGDAARRTATPLRRHLHQQHLRVLKLAAQEYRRAVERDGFQGTDYARSTLRLLNEALDILEERELAR
jgi:hypothetical protein